MEVGRVLLWVVGAVVVAVVLAVGFVVHQLRRLYSDEGEGLRIVESVESDLLDRYSGRLRGDVSPHCPFGEVSVELSPVSGNLADIDVGDVLEVLAGHFAEPEGSDWRLDARMGGDWNRRAVTVHGLDFAH